MARQNFPKDIKNLNLFLQQEDSEIQSAIQDALSNGRDKFYMARLLDLYIKKTNKQLEQHNLLIEGMLMGVPQIKIEEALRAHANGEIRKQLNSITMLSSLISPSLQLVHPEGDALIADMESAAASALKTKTLLEHNLAAAQFARNTVALSPSEEAKVYRSIESLYEEQVRNRKWYQHDLVGILSLIIFPLYFLWKAQRKAEIIQPNEHTLTDKSISRHGRQHFKEHVNTLEGRQNTYITEKSLCGEYDAPPPPFLTKHKKARNEFFRNHKEWFWSVDRVKNIENNDIDWLLKSKEEDEELRLTLGIK